jgi:hypothetical protein
MAILGHLLRPPKVDAWYPIELGNGHSKVVEVEWTGDGSWTRVLLEYVAGCMPVPPEGRPDAPEDDWELPVARTWLTRAEWIEHARHVPRSEWPSLGPRVDDKEEDDEGEEADEESEANGAAAAGDIAPDLGLAWLEAGYKDKTIVFSRVAFWQLTWMKDNLFGFTINMTLETAYAISFDFGRDQLEELLALLPGDMAEWIWQQFDGSYKASQILDLPRMCVGLEATLGTVHSNERESWVPLVVSSFSPASPTVKVEILDPDASRGLLFTWLM